MTPLSEQSNDSNTPTKTEILETYWVKFLKWAKNNRVAESVCLDEDAFWEWYIEHKLGGNDDA